MSEAEGPWLDPGEAKGGLLLFAPAEPPAGFAEALPPVLAAGGIVALVVGGGRDWQAVRQRCREQAVACLVRDDLDLVLSLRADGVHLGDPSGVGEARRRLGADAIVGAACGPSRHLAMVAGEDGATYVMFEAPAGRRDPDASIPELCRWWTELFVLPCATPLAGAELHALVEAGADFVAVGEEVWGHPNGAATAVRELAQQLAGVP